MQAWDAVTLPLVLRWCTRMLDLLQTFLWTLQSSAPQLLCLQVRLGSPACCPAMATSGEALLPHMMHTQVRLHLELTGIMPA